MALNNNKSFNKGNSKQFDKHKLWLILGISIAVILILSLFLYSPLRKAVVGKAVTGILATVYENKDYKTPKHELVKSGEIINLHEYGFGNKISSIQIAEDYKALLYYAEDSTTIDPDKLSLFVTLVKDSSFLGFNDRITSVKVMGGYPCKAELYEHGYSTQDPGKKIVVAGDSSHLTPEIEYIEVGEDCKEVKLKQEITLQNGQKIPYTYFDDTESGTVNPPLKFPVILELKDIDDQKKCIAKLCSEENCNAAGNVVTIAESFNKGDLNDKVTSVKVVGGSNCWAELYEDAHYNGAVLRVTGNNPYLDANDNIDFIKLEAFYICLPGERSGNDKYLCTIEKTLKECTTTATGTTEEIYGKKYTCDGTKWEIVEEEAPEEEAPLVEGVPITEKIPTKKIPPTEIPTAKEEAIPEKPAIKVEKKAFFEKCDDQVDNDGDGIIDCFDSDCEGQSCGPGCLCKSEEVTINNVPITVRFASETDCTDTQEVMGGPLYQYKTTKAVDNDGDGKANCADPDCAGKKGPDDVTCCQTDADCSGKETCDSNTNICITKVSLVKGDVNCNSQITNADVLLVKQYVLKKITEFSNCPTGKTSADVNCDNKITNADVLLIKKYVLKKITEFPCSG